MCERGYDTMMKTPSSSINVREQNVEAVKKLPMGHFQAIMTWSRYLNQNAMFIDIDLILPGFRQEQFETKSTPAYV